MDDYSKSGPKTPQSAAQQRASETHRQMSDLLASKDEETLVLALKSKYGLTPRDPRYNAIMRIWRDAQQRLRQDR